MHLSIADAKGDSAIFEFVNGKMTVHRGPDTVVMTNEPAFAIQRSNLLRYRLFGGKLSMPGDIDPKSRFCSRFQLSQNTSEARLSARGDCGGLQRHPECRCALRRA